MNPKLKAQPQEIFRKHGGQLRMSEALACGITRYTLYALRDGGVVEQITRGVYRLRELPSLSNPDLVSVSLRFPKAVVCLVSALAWHDITTQIPHVVSVAVPKNSRTPTLDYPPVKAHKFSHDAYETGIDEHLLDGTPVKIYDPEKTLADCFKFRNKIGMDVVLEALKLHKARNGINLVKLLEYARVCRVENVIRPYLEMLV
ncbi:MAG: type IV toxin-antitoxin system AbiEi family antitoxin domain-containing protein [Nitrospinae bacterium]|nr:type IV toxin-antitoxin system AbiEi family antitoxin domain-containing protein [Nitrospinota bacterium]